MADSHAALVSQPQTARKRTVSQINVSCYKPAMALPILLDMDNACSIPAADVDDALALALALASPEVELVACTASAGNCLARESYAVTRHMLMLAERPDIPLGLGPDNPLRRDRWPHFAHLDAKRRESGCELWNNAPAIGIPDKYPPDTSAADVIIAAVRKHPGELVIVATGSLTNVALALQQAPEIAAELNGIFHMGGAWPVEPGEEQWENATPDIPPEIWRDVLRFNPLYDPEATEIVLHCGAAVTFMPANVTMQTCLTEDALPVPGPEASAFSRFLHETCLPWIRWSRTQRGIPGMHLHDPLALAAAFRPELFHFREMSVDMDILLRPDGNFLTDAPAIPSCRCAVAADEKTFLKLFGERILAMF